MTVFTDKEHRTEVLKGVPELVERTVNQYKNRIKQDPEMTFGKLYDETICMHISTILGDNGLIMTKNGLNVKQVKVKFRYFHTLLRKELGIKKGFVKFEEMHNVVDVVLANAGFHHT